MSPPFDEPAISLFVREHEEPGIEVRVNFGLFAGRHATPAEIDDLAASLRELVPEFAIVAEERHELSPCPSHQGEAAWLHVRNRMRRARRKRVT